MLKPTSPEGIPDKVSSYWELMYWMLRRDDSEGSVQALVETLHVAVQRDEDDEWSFPERRRPLNTECGFMYGEGALKGRFLKGYHSAARETVWERNTLGVHMAE